MTSFEAALTACLDALADGREIDECLRDYPQHAERLRPQLVAATSVARTYGAAAPSEQFTAAARARFLVASGEALQQAFSDTTPREEFAEAARERFLIATGERLTEAFDNEPSPSFFAAARMRLLMTAHRMRREATAPRRRWVPSLMPGLRAAGALAAVITVFAGLSTYTVASADNSLPGDWQYPIKLKTEQIRLALAFSDGSKRNVRLNIARERANEIAELARNGEAIGPSELHRLVSQTAPLVAEVDSGDWNPSELDKLQEISAKQQEALALAEPQVEAAAQGDLLQAKTTAEDALRTAARARVYQGPPIVITPSLRLTATPGPDASSTAAPQASATPVDGSGTGILTPAASTPTIGPSATSTRTSTPVAPISLGTPADAALGVTWIKLSVGRITALIPSPKDGWYIQGLNVADGNIPVPTLIHLSNIDATSLVTINTQNGDVYWLLAHNGRFDEVQMRLNRDGEVLVVDRTILAAYGRDADIPLYILDSIVLAPVPATVAPLPKP